jgi:hypothetical protein
MGHHFPDVRKMVRIDVGAEKNGSRYTAAIFFEIPQ